MSDSTTRRTTIGGKSLEQLRDHYHRYLFEEYLPFWDRHGIDHEHGGFMCTLDHDGTRLNDNKSMWYQGRGLWVYSFLYRHFGGEENLQVATGARDFLLQHGRDGNGDWVQMLERDGRIRPPGVRRGYAGLFVAEGMQAYARAAGDDEAMAVALDSLERSLAMLDDPDRDIDEGYPPISYPGMRTLGQHMVLILILTQLLEQLNTPRLRELSDRVVDAIMERFWNPEYRLTNEALDRDYNRPDDENEDFVYLGHAIETHWMMLVEALRRDDRELFERVAERFKRHLEVAWDDVYGGLFRGMNVHGQFIFDKVMWAQEEGMIGCMILCEHTDWEWPSVWFGRLFDYVEEKFALRQHGYPLYMGSGDRKVTYQPHVSRKENYHHPRCVMRNLLAVERLLDDDGRISAPWSDGGATG